MNADGESLGPASNEKAAVCVVCGEATVLRVIGFKGFRKPRRSIELGYPGAANSQCLESVDENPESIKCHSLRWGMTRRVKRVPLVEVSSGSHDNDCNVIDESRFTGNENEVAIDREVSDTVYLTDSGSESDDRQVMESSSESGESTRRAVRRRFEEFAKGFARRIADAHKKSSVEVEGEKETEKWSGPFSSVMKIARDRTTEDLQVTNSSSNKNYLNKLKSPPSLEDLCLGILAKNAASIASLGFVPDAFRNRLSWQLCDSRKMNKHFLNLLLHGTPTEVRIKDCSWLNEREFVRSFQGCDTSKLMILQLDQCGRCMVDSALMASLARSSNSLPALKSLSLSGACCLSDVGIIALVSSAPALQSINISQCSFLTSSSIDTLAKSLGSTLRELYLNDCQNLVPMLMISALKKFEHLEVLSLAGIHNVCDNFIQEFISARRHNMKEIILTDCVRLTGKSIKAISETCPALCAIDLVNLTELNDYTLSCLASGCQTLQKVKFSRNSFSDEAVAAFVEFCGENLEELSLNYVRKVSHCTALSLASFSWNLVSLDLSWCRNLTEEALRLIVDNCRSLRVLKLFGCSQVTNEFVDGHSNAEVQIIGMKTSPLCEYFEPPNPHQGPLRYSSMPYSS